MATEKRLIDANKYPCQNCEVSYCYKNCEKFNAWFKDTVNAVEVVHGRWENVTGGMVMIGNCSECKVRQPVIETNYCKNCGAKMDGDANG